MALGRAIGEATGPVPVSPCLGICLMDPRTRTCRGCLRTIEEIARWYYATPAEKRAILDRLAARRAATEGWR
jgi:predicted Fe-S protein YdhL (DUF1289 family)